MVEHDSLCVWSGREDPQPEQPCGNCQLIARVRADEREKIATAIEALPIDHRSPGRATPTGLVTFVRQEAYWRAARIARGGGADA